MTPTLESITELIKDSMYQGHGAVMQELKDLRQELSVKVDDISASVDGLINQNAALGEWRIHADNKMMKLMEADKEQSAKIESAMSFQWKAIGAISAIAFIVPFIYSLIEKAVAFF